MESQLEFFKLEYESLRKEIEVISKELRDTEKYTILAIAAVWVWIITNDDKIPNEGKNLLWWLPVFLVAIGFFRFLGVKQSLEKIANYIATNIEPTFLKEGLGWENYLRNSPNNNKIQWWISSYLIWGALFFTTTIVANMMSCL